MTRLTCTLIALVLVAGTALAQYDDQSTSNPFPWREIGIGAAQFGVAATLGNAIGWIGGYTGLMAFAFTTGEDAIGTPEDGRNALVLAGVSVALAPLTIAGATCLMGNALYPSGTGGTFGGTVAGSYVGLLAGLGIIFGTQLATEHSISPWGGPWLLPTSLLPDIGALVGYHLSRPNRESGIGYRGPGHERRTTNAERRFCPSRFDLPTVGLRFRGKDDNPSSTALDLRLLSVHF